MPGVRVSTQRLRPVGSRGVALEATDPEDPKVSEAVGERTPGAGPRADSRAMSMGPRGVGQILDTALDVLFARFAPCVGFATLFILPFRLGGELLAAEQRLLWEFTYALPELLTSAFVCSLVGAHFLQRRATAGAAFRGGLVALPGITVIACLKVVSVFGLTCLCVIPSILGYWIFAVMPAVYVLERGDLVRRAQAAPGTRWAAGVGLAILRGMRLVFERGAFLRWAGWSVVGLCVLYLPLNLSAGVMDAPQVRHRLHEILPLQGRAVWIALASIGAVFAGIGTAYLAILNTVYYLDQRVRREALDLELFLDARRTDGA